MLFLPPAVSISPRASEAVDPTLAALENGVKSFFLVRYLTIATCAWLFFEYFLTAEYEVELIWKAPKNVAKFAFLVYRYAALASITLVVYSTSGDGANLDESFCRRLVPAFAVLTVLFGLVADVLAVLHVAQIWKRNIKVFVVLTLCFITATGVAIGSRGVALSRLTPTVQHNIILNTCISTERPTLLAIPWGAALCFDLVVMAFIYWNAVNRARDPPLDPYEMHAPVSIVHSLYRDGIGYFVTVAAIRILNLILTLSTPLWIFGLVASISWPTFTVNLSRFIFRLRGQQNRNERASLARNFEQDPDAAGGEASSIEMRDYCHTDLFIRSNASDV